MTTLIALCGLFPLHIDRVLCLSTWPGLSSALAGRYNHPFSTYPTRCHCFVCQPLHPCFCGPLPPPGYRLYRALPSAHIKVDHLFHQTGLQTRSVWDLDS
ncbi:hypothetical protein BS50DRAFT_131181 [Corynespora cassiicola Philippines]|uniref:Secreted protein n=1 Tax=Corynespora cassiicola Philippines TaxID=1448308 RepID=A0A2T2NBX3_CORCC|nr:hypothetical protein BS50DRAFT_131181 [Corynespora cassiicola Philippines]